MRESVTLIASNETVAIIALCLEVFHRRDAQHSVCDILPSDPFLDSWYYYQVIRIPICSAD